METPSASLSPCFLLFTSTSTLYISSRIQFRHAPNTTPLTKGTYAWTRVLRSKDVVRALAFTRSFAFTAHSVQRALRRSPMDRKTVLWEGPMLSPASLLFAFSFLLSAFCFLNATEQAAHNPWHSFLPKRRFDLLREILIETRDNISYFRPSELS